MQIDALYRYPVKGLSPEAIESVSLEAGRYVPGDRLLAIENGPSGFDPEAPVHQPKIKYIQLMRNERLATLRTSFDAATGTLTIARPGASVAEDVLEPSGRRQLETYIEQFMGGEARGPLKVLSSPDGFRFTDSRNGFVSIVGLESVAAIGRMAGRTIDPLRFRANVFVSGLPAFAELDLVGQELLAPGGARLRITKRTVRCAAVNVDPKTGARDMDIPRLLMRELGHMDCGIYASVIRGGEITRGQTLTRVQDSLPFTDG